MGGWKLLQQLVSQLINLAKFLLQLKSLLQKSSEKSIYVRLKLGQNMNTLYIHEVGRVIW